MAIAYLTSKDLQRWLVAAGIIDEKELAQRVIIDIRIDDVVKIYVQRVASDKMLTVPPLDLSGAEITVV